MAPSKRPRENNAAYAASQGLFDNLRHALTGIEEQVSNLTKARDIVQTIHVKLAAEDTTGDEEHARYISAIVKATRVALDGYGHVFNELVNLTNADASEGKEEKAGHEQFFGILTSIMRALQLANEFPLYEEMESPSAKGSGSAGRDQADMKDVGTGEDGGDSDGDLSKASGSVKRSNAPSADSEERPKKLQRMSENRETEEVAPKKKKNKKDNKSPKDSPTNGTEAVAAIDVLTTTHSAVSAGVEFEDVTAEVDARLEAKREARRERKKAGRRERQRSKKREAQGVDAEEANGDTNEQPSKKKRKTQHTSQEYPKEEIEVVVGRKRAREEEREDEGDWAGKGVAMNGRVVRETVAKKMRTGKKMKG